MLSSRRAVVRLTRRTASEGIALVPRISTHRPAQPSRRHGYSTTCTTEHRRPINPAAIVDAVTAASPKDIRYDNVFLRDACSCNLCVNPSSKQKSFSTAQLPADVHPKMTSLLDNGDVMIKWTASGYPDHVSTYTPQQLQRLGDPLARYNARWNFAKPQLLWNAEALEGNLVSRSYDKYLSDDDAFKDVVMGLYSVGIAFVTDAPAAERDTDGQIVVEKLAKKIGYIKETFYGTSWDVIALPDAKNIAYTSVNLPLHMDLLYYESPPGIQLLHCVSNTADGGESVYADSFRAAKIIHDRDPAAFKALCTFPITFHYDNDGHHYMHSRPVIELDPFYRQYHPSMPEYKIRCVNYSPPFQAPFDHHVTQSEIEPSTLTEHGEFREFLRAYKMFEEILYTRAEQFEDKFMPGVIALFMNRRVLHSRREFKLGSSDTAQEYGRWLKGTYLDIDSFYSKLRVLSGL
ncbi:uncharacterized protein V1518DRAFT_90654 [Limtongia smithiae]|uniref:uncharacterized protein n=1 Tax=Limtongia smithiae TaxID=1125753 RepID=UPI0034CDA035